MKTIKNYIWMAAATMMAAALGACSNDDLAVRESPVQQSKVVTLTATLSPKNDVSTTRALSDEGTYLHSTWTVGDELYVSYIDNNSNNQYAKGRVTSLDGSGKATVTVDLVDPKDASNIQFRYPYNLVAHVKDLYLDQIGTLPDLAANYDDFYGDGTLSVSGTVATLPTEVVWYRNTSVWKLKFTVGGVDITNTITKLSIMSINIGNGLEVYDVTPSSLSEIYVALEGVYGLDVTITAATPTGIYSATKSGITLAPGYFYRSTVPLTAAAESSKYRKFTSRTDFSDLEILGNIPVESTTTTWSAGWYVVSGNVTINGNVSVTGNVNLILKDGASLTVNGIIYGPSQSLYIYGQELSTGKLTVVSNGTSIEVDKLTIHGGIITATDGGVTQGLQAMHNFDIYHGTFTAAGSDYGIISSGGIHIYGGNVTCSATDGNALHLFGQYDPRNLTVSGGTLNATATGAGKHGIGVGNGYGTTSIDFSGGTVVARGGASSDTKAGGNAINVCGTLTISGSAKVTAVGGSSNTAKNGGDAVKVFAGSSAGGTFTMTGGYLNAAGGAGYSTGAAGLGISNSSTIALTGVTMYEGDAGNPSTPAASQTACTKRFVIIK